MIRECAKLIWDHNSPTHAHSFDGINRMSGAASRGAARAGLTSLYVRFAAEQPEYEIDTRRTIERLA